MKVNIKLIFFLGLISCLLASCVSSKKYKNIQHTLMLKEVDINLLQTKMEQKDSTIFQLEKAISNLQNAIEKQDLKIEYLNREVQFKNEKIRGLETDLMYVKTLHDTVSRKNDYLTKSHKVFAEITKNLLEELEMQNLKVLNLSIAVEQRDSLNIHLVKKAKRNMSDKKYKKALEKLGFVFQ
ncbi:MAG: hypothetical protein WAT79_00110 [Saprospiraceae bacterium]